MTHGHDLEISLEFRRQFKGVDKDECQSGVNRESKTVTLE